MTPGHGGPGVDPGRTLVDPLDGRAGVDAPVPTPGEGLGGDEVSASLVARLRAFSSSAPAPPPSQPISHAHITADPTHE